MVSSISTTTCSSNPRAWSPRPWARHWRVLVFGTTQGEVDWAGAAEVRVKLGVVAGLGGFTHTTPAGLPITNNFLQVFTWDTNPNAAIYRFVLSLAADLSAPINDTTR